MNLSTRTGISSDMVQKGLGALSASSRRSSDEETFDKLQSSIPDASRLTSQHESSPEAAPSQGGLFEMVSGLAGKLLGGQAGAGADLLSIVYQARLQARTDRGVSAKALELIKTIFRPNCSRRSWLPCR